MLLGQFFSSSTYVFFYCIITAVLDTDFELHVHLTRRTDGRRLGTFQEGMLFSEIGGTEYKALKFSRVSVFR